MKRGDYVVRFTTYRILSPGSYPALGSQVHKDVMPILHASGALEIEKPTAHDSPREVVVVYGPGMWQSMAPVDAAGKSSADV